MIFEGKNLSRRLLALSVCFCESTADFTLEETARLVGKALGSAADADVAMIIVNGVNSRPPRSGCTKGSGLAGSER